MGKRTYKLVITPSSNANAPTFEELMQTDVKEWIMKILEHKARSGEIEIDFSKKMMH